MKIVDVLYLRNLSGEGIIFVESIVWSFFPIVTLLIGQSIDPIFSLLLCTIISSIFFLILVFKNGSWKDLFNTTVYKDIFWVAFFIGFLFYGFVFIGLSFTSAGNASIISLSEVIFAYILFNIFRKEAFSRQAIIGTVLALSGVIIIIFPKNLTDLNVGDILILLAAICGPFGNFYQKRVSGKIASEALLLLRTSFTIPFLLVLYFLFGKGNLNNIENVIPLLLVNGIFAFGYSKLLWIEGIKKISVTKANALSSIYPIFTLIFSWLLISEKPTVWQLIAIIPVIIGVNLLIRKSS